MKLVRWKRFTWNLKQLPPLPRPLPSHFQLRGADRSEQEPVTKLILSCLALHNAWGDSMRLFQQRLDRHLEALFRSQDVPALVISHGQRIIAASAIAPFPSFDNHLVSGPCVLIEYHNRGLGTVLLHSCLHRLHHMGLDQAHGVTMANATAARFLYTKFGSTSVDCDYDATADEDDETH